MFGSIVLTRAASDLFLRRSGNEAHAERAQDGVDGLKARMRAGRQRLVEAFPAKTRVPRDLRHAPRFRHLSERPQQHIGVFVLGGRDVERRDLRHAHAPRPREWRSTVRSILAPGDTPETQSTCNRVVSMRPNSRGRRAGQVQSFATSISMFSKNLFATGVSQPYCRSNRMKSFRALSISFIPDRRGPSAWFAPSINNLP
jgi:hypothetical protein